MFLRVNSVKYAFVNVSLMIELWHLAVVVVIFAVYLLLLVILFARMIAALLMGLVAKIPELMGAGAKAIAEEPPIPKVKIIDAIGYGIVKAIQSPKFDEAIGKFLDKISGDKKS